MKKRLISLAVALMMMGVLLVGCGGTPAASSAPPPADTSASAASTPEVVDDGLPAVGDFSEQIDLTWVIAGDMTAYKDGNFVQEALNERFNVNITTMPTNTFDADKLNSMLAAGDIPDVFVRWENARFYSEGITQTIDMAMVEKYMPQSKAVYDSMPAAWPAVTDEASGEIIALPQITLLGAAVNHMGIRQDWLDNLDVDMPKTLEELTEVLRLFTEEDPDGNGQKDTYGMAMPGASGGWETWLWTNVFGAYGVQVNRWLLDDNGEVTWGAVMDGTKAALKQLNAWYEAGYIDPNWTTTDESQYTSLMHNGAFGVWQHVHPSYIDYTNPNSNASLTRANNPDANWVQMAPPEGPGGVSGGFSFAPSGVGGWGLMFGVNTSTEQIARAMQIAEAINTDMDLFTLVTYGKEGETFTRPVEGANYATLMPGIVAAEYGVQAFRTAQYILEEQYSILNPPQVLEYTLNAMEYNMYKDVINTASLEGLKTDDDLILIDEAEMLKITQEFFYRAINGEVDIDTGWDAFVESWYDLGGTRKTELARTLTVTE